MYIYIYLFIYAHYIYIYNHRFRFVGISKIPHIPIIVASCPMIPPVLLLKSSSNPNLHGKQSPSTTHLSPCLDHKKNRSQNAPPIFSVKSPSPSLSPALGPGAAPAAAAPPPAPAALRCALPAWPRRCGGVGGPSAARRRRRTWHLMWLIMAN